MQLRKHLLTLQKPYIMSDLVFLKYVQLIIFTAFIVTYVALVIVIIKEQFKKDK